MGGKKSKYLDGLEDAPLEKKAAKVFVLWDMKSNITGVLLSFA